MGITFAAPNLGNNNVGCVINVMETEKQNIATLVEELKTQFEDYVASIYDLEKDWEGDLKAVYASFQVCVGDAVSLEKESISEYQRNQATFITNYRALNMQVEEMAFITDK